VPEHAAGVRASPTSALGTRTPFVPDPPETAPVPEAIFARIFAISVDAIIAVSSNQRILLFNQGAESIFGYQADEVLGQPLSLLLPESARSRHGQEVERFGNSPVAARRMGERGEIAGRRKSGELFPAEASISKMDVDGDYVFAAVLRDISERKRLERERAELLERERESRAAAEAAERRATFLADASALLDRSLDYEQTLRSVARAVVPMLADVCVIDVMQEDGAVRRLDVSHADPAHGAIARDLLRFPTDATKPFLTRRAMETGQSHLEPVVTPATLASLTQHPEHLRLLAALGPRSLMAVPLLARGRTLGAVAFLSTRPERSYTAADLSLAEEVARRASYAVDNALSYGEAQRATRARDEVLGIVSHDLRNPLSTIAMCARALTDSLAAPDEGVRYMVDAISRSTEWMKRLIQDLLDIASLDAGHLSIEPHGVPLTPLIGDVVEMFEPSARAQDLRLEGEVVDATPDVHADRERLLQVIANLVGNAVKFTEGGGSVRVTARSHDADSIRIEVSDTGCGIPAEDLPHLFDRFWHVQRNAARRGTGLGLAIAKGIVEAHGGRIDVVSEVGVGTTFSFVLRRAP
jgi:PAS domain S-box-containing protein